MLYYLTDKMRNKPRPIVTENEADRFNNSLRENRSSSFEGVDCEQEYMRHKVTISSESPSELKSSSKHESTEQPTSRQQPRDSFGERVRYSSTSSKVEDKYALDK